MGRTNDHHRVRDAARRALATIRARGITPSPENYVVWYTHHADINPGLSRMIRLLEANGDPLDDSRCRELYVRYILQDEAEKQMVRASERIDAVAGSLAGILSSSRSEGEQSHARFDAIGEELASARVADLKTLVRQLGEETARMAARAGELGQELRRSSEQIASLRADLERLRREAERDPLTGVANRRHFERRLREAVSVAAGDGPTFSLFVLDVDHFKAFNDTHGHAVGDVVLRLVASHAARRLRDGDLLARLGGEEFVALLPGLDLDGAVPVAERVRSGIAGRRLRAREQGRDLGTVTVSIGIAQHRPDDDADTVLHRADRALYVAKAAGRNRVVDERALAAAGSTPSSAGASGRLA